MQKVVDSAMDVEEIVRQIDNEDELKRSLIRVDKLIDVENDYLKALTRDNVQLLVNKLWELPTERVDEVIVAKLPAPVTILPREKRLPTVKKETKWESFAKLKGINKRKRGRMVWDEELKKWIPRWGYKSQDETKDWAIEVPDQVDPFEDQFAKRVKAKKERVAKNELHRLTNIARNSKGKIKAIGLMPTKMPNDRNDLTVQMTAARKSTASMGKFDPKIKNDTNKSSETKWESFAKLSNFKLSAAKPLVDKNRAANLEISAKEAKKAAKRMARDEDDEASNGERGKKFNKGKNKNGGRGGVDNDYHRAAGGMKTSKKTLKKVRGTSKHSLHKRRKV
ncbi:hypothetical protein HELRODRAFT_182457 [Helobdella robusta]|uniref:Ribosome biogenesis regulatory protein n=1 Tax=Helobdella robusta TaxID=6412 RepID=T1FI82_HELRO|nr:hypothetical protein HELRODRAFT_182457 [Helobdella robusta]ESN90985.1 hypothetical protein HELRODRAFT_182457 [Helobdella robusta]